MSFQDLLIDVITVYSVTDGATDRYGNPTDALDSGTDLPARVQPESQDEQEGGRRDTRVTKLKVFTEIADITGTSLVDYKGDRYEVFGEVEMYEDRNAPHHLEFTLRRTEG